MEIASKTQLENVEKHPEYLSAVKAMEEARQEQISAQKAVDQTRMKDAQAENAKIKSSQRREVALKNVDKAEKESERLENMLRGKRSDLLIARRRR
ncbi:MAG: hypothetical protein HC898_05220 [Phycisphaerales bacterium]|nr:hypothetical protein [Phycisphaerales bacterium]